MARIRIGEAMVDFDARSIERGGDATSVEPKVLAVLEMLAERSGEVVSRNELVDAIWDVKYGGDERLSRAISLLRSALGDDAGTQGCIQTIPKQGYRLIAKADTDEPGQAKAKPAIKARTMFVPAPPNSIAVLPFDDMSAEGDRRYMGDGMAEEIINALANVHGLHVTGRMSSFAMRDTGLDLRQVGDQLGVSYLLEGSVRQVGEVVRITTQLVSAEDGFHRWSKEFDGHADELFEVYGTVAQEVTHHVAELLGLATHSMVEVEGGPGRDREVYQLFLSGRSATHQQDGERTLPKAIEMLGEVVDRDPEFAEAWAFLGIAHFFMLEYSQTPRWRYHLAEGRKATERAIMLAPESPTVGVPQIFVAALDGRMDRQAHIAMALHEKLPGQPLGQYYLSVSLIACGLMEDGLSHLENVLEKEPLSIAGHSLIGTARHVIGEAEHAHEPYLRAFDLGFLPSGITAIWLLAGRGEIDEAERILRERYEELSPLFENVFGMVARPGLMISAVVHRREWARAILAHAMRRRLGKGEIQPNAGALIMPVILGRPKLFMEACRKISATYLAGTLAQIWNGSIEARQVRDDPEFPAFARELGLVSLWDEIGWPPMLDRARFPASSES